MNQSLHFGREPNFNNVLILSTILHLIFILAVTIPIKSRDRDFQSYTVNLVTPVEVRKSAPADKAESTVKKDTAPVVKVKKTPRRRTKAETRKKTGVSLKTREKKKTERVSREIERLKAISAIAKLKKEKEVQTAIEKESDKEAAEAIASIRDKKVIDVSSAARAPGNKAATGSNAYIGLVQHEIWSEWIPPADYSGMEVIISFHIKSDGSVTAPDIEKSSGNSYYDRSGVKAILKASPLPSPPVEMDFVVRFH